MVFLGIIIFDVIGELLKSPLGFFLRDTVGKVAH